jgi:hypothetical protein
MNMNTQEAGRIAYIIQVKDEQIAKLTKQRDELLAALKFYKDAWKYKTNKNFGGLEWFPEEELLDDCGNIARVAISTVEADQ